LSSEFVSGHLGNYSSCPDEGYTPAAPAGEQGGAGLAGDCAAEDCGIYNCDTAQITFTITNTGEVEGLDLAIATIELYDVDGTLVAELPVIEVLDMDAMDMEASVPMSNIAPDTTKLFMVTFQGPAEPWTLLSTDSERGYGHSGTVVIRFQASNHADFLLKSPLIYVLDNIAT